jgi:ankyrin repeat protein
MLISAGADVNIKTKSIKYRIIIASGYGYFEIARALISKGAHVNEVNVHRWSALYVSQSIGHSDIVLINA